MPSFESYSGERQDRGWWNVKENGEREKVRPAGGSAPCGVSPMTRPVFLWDTVWRSLERRQHTALLWEHCDHTVSFSNALESRKL